VNDRARHRSYDAKASLSIRRLDVSNCEISRRKKTDSEALPDERLMAAPHIDA
jgi:hypothetical protein